MNIEQALEIIDIALRDESLNNIQEFIFRQAWEGKTYVEIAQSADYDPDYIRDLGYKLWQLLSKALQQKVTKNNFHSVLRRRWGSFSMKAQGYVERTDTTDINISVHNTPIEQLRATPKLMDARRVTVNQYQDWGEAIDVPVFYGRTEELTTLKQWTMKDRCRLLAVLGMGGIGKTALVGKLAEQVQDGFEYLIWRSLRKALPIEEFLSGLLQFLSNQQETEIALPKDVDSRISQLINYFRKYRCLLVLDNAETILRRGEYAGCYRAEYEGYGELLKRIGEALHQSCLVLTSQEKPKEFLSLEGEMLPVRSLQLVGLKLAECQKIFRLKGAFSGTISEWEYLIDYYVGNPLALKIVAAGIQDLFNKSISEFLEFVKQGTLVFDGIRGLLDQQFSRLSDLEKDIMYWLAIERKPISFSELQADILSPVSPQALLEALRSLGQRSLIEKNSHSYTQKPMIMDYITEQVIEQFYREINAEIISLFNSHALIKAQVKGSVRASSTRVILEPIVDKMHTTFGCKKNIEIKLKLLLLKLKENLSIVPGYASGNIINLLHQLKMDLTDYDFSNLTVWQADLRDTNLHRVNFANADLAGSIFAESLDNSLSIRAPKLYEGMNITGVTGLTEVQKATLRALGAVENGGFLPKHAISPDNSFHLTSPI